MADGGVSFATDIRPLFRPKDVDSMKRIRGFDLSSYADVRARADEIMGRLRKGDMPCDGAWPAQQVSLFVKWVSEGKLP